jgi:hypothetical protein
VHVVPERLSSDRLSTVPSDDYNGEKEQQEELRGGAGGERGGGVEEEAEDKPTQFSFRRWRSGWTRRGIPE